MATLAVLQDRADGALEGGQIGRAGLAGQFDSGFGIRLELRKLLVEAGQSDQILGDALVSGPAPEPSGKKSPTALAVALIAAIAALATAGL